MSTQQANGEGGRGGGIGGSLIFGAAGSGIGGYLGYMFGEKSARRRLLELVQKYQEGLNVRENFLAKYPNDGDLFDILALICSDERHQSAPDAEIEEPPPPQQPEQHQPTIMPHTSEQHQPTISLCPDQPPVFGPEPKNYQSWLLNTTGTGFNAPDERTKTWAIFSGDFKKTLTAEINKMHPKVSTTPPPKKPPPKKITTSAPAANEAARGAWITWVLDDENNSPATGSSSAWTGSDRNTIEFKREFKKQYQNHRSLAEMLAQCTVFEATNGLNFLRRADWRTQLKRETIVAEYFKKMFSATPDTASSKINNYTDVELNKLKEGEFVLLLARMVADAAQKNSFVL